MTDGKSIADLMTAVMYRGLIEGELEDTQATEFLAVTQSGSTYSASLTADFSFEFLYDVLEKGGANLGDVYTMRQACDIVINGVPEPRGTAIGFSVANGTLVILDANRRRIRRSSNATSVLVS